MIVNYNRAVVTRTRVVWWIAIAIGALMFVFPPMEHTNPYGHRYWAGYTFLFGQEAEGRVTDWTRLFVQFAAIGGGAWALTREKK